MDLIAVGCASDLCKVCILRCPWLEFAIVSRTLICPCLRFEIVYSHLVKSLCTADATELSLLNVLKYLELVLALIYCETSSLFPSSSLDASLSSVRLFKLPIGLPTDRFTGGWCVYATVGCNVYGTWLTLNSCDSTSLCTSSSLDASLSSVFLFKLPFGLPTCRLASS